MNKKIPITREQIDAQVKAGHQAILKERSSGPGPNNALFWFPKIPSNIKTPNTLFVNYDPYDLFPMLDAKEPKNLDKLIGDLDKASQEIGYPVFIRLDMRSDKHDGPDAYKANSKDDLPRIIAQTFEFNCIADDAWYSFAWMVREWLDIEYTFTAFDGHRIGKERRIFANFERTFCNHFYWPEEAFERDAARNAIPEDWKEQLKELSKIERYELDWIQAAAIMTVRSIGEGTWSVDFAKIINGTWYLIDMALARTSWHPEDCPTLTRNK